MIPPKISSKFNIPTPDEMIVIHSDGENFLTSRAFFEKHLAEFEGYLR